MCKSCLIIIITQTDSYNFPLSLLIIPPFMWIKGEFLFSFSSETLFLSSFVAPSYILWGAQIGPCFEKWLSLLPCSLGSPLVKGPASSLVPRRQVSQASPVGHTCHLPARGSFISFLRSTSLPPGFLFSIVAHRAGSETRFPVTLAHSLTSLSLRFQIHQISTVTASPLVL